MLEKNVQPKTYRIGIVAPRTFNDVTVLHELLAEKLLYVSHVNTNNVVAGGETVQTYLRQVGLPFTVYPISPQVGGALISNSQIVRNSDFVYILDDGQSDNAANVVKECDKQHRKYKTVSYQALPTKQIQIDKARVLIQEKIAEMLQLDKSVCDSRFLEKLLKVLD